MVQAIPEGYPALSPYLSVPDAEAAIAFYSTVFGATERLRLDGPGGRIGHAELTIGDSLLMLADEFPGMNPSPRTVGGTPVTLSVYVADVDATFEQAMAAGAASIRPVADQFYGDRSRMFEDPFGHRWNVTTHIEDVSPEDMAARSAKLSASGELG
jgi:PhnB protein